MRYHILHTTAYGYEAPVLAARHLLHLSPRACPWQQVVTQALRISPNPAARHDGRDAFANPVSRIELATPHSAFEVTSALELDVGERPWAGRLDVSPAWERVREQLEYAATPLPPEIFEAQRVRFESPGVRVKRELETYASPSFARNRPLLAAARELMGRIHAEFLYDPSATVVGTSVLEVLEKRRGVCQDFAHLMIGCLRSLGLAARYVSGYLRTDPPAGQPRLVGADATHAWVAVFVPELGWVEFDPTNDCFADERHIVLAWGRDFGDVSPVRGVIQGGGAHTLDVGVTVLPRERRAAERRPA